MTPEEREQMQVEWLLEDVKKRVSTEEYQNIERKIEEWKKSWI